MSIIGDRRSANAVPDRMRRVGKLATAAVLAGWALMVASLTRQLDRTDLPETARAALEKARTELVAAMATADAVRGAELWSWSQANGVYRVEFFGQRAGDETESNAAQLWSTVSLARR
jgi:hypothetical protein